MKALCLVAITTMLTACSDSGAIIGNPDTSGNGNSSVENENDFSGQWTGTWSNSSTLVESCGTASAPFVLDIDQTGNTVSANASLDCNGTPIDNLLTGTISGSEISLTDANSRDTFTLAVESSTTIAGSVLDATETLSADILITR